MKQSQLQILCHNYFEYAAGNGVLEDVTNRSRRALSVSGALFYTSCACYPSSLLLVRTI